MKTTIPQTVQGWLIRLYTSETKLARMKDQHAPQEKIDKARAWLRQQWEQAKAVGVSDKMFSAYGEALYLEDVSIALDHSFRDACARHATYSKKLAAEKELDSIFGKGPERSDPLRPCAHFDDSGCCSPFCPKFKQKQS